MSTDEYDEFDDYKRDHAGIFGVGALKDHEGCVHTVVREGVNLEFSCQGCGRSTRVTLEWPELVALKYGHNPAIIFARAPQLVQTPMSWVWGEDGWRPDAKCPHCGFYFGLRLNSGEPEAILKHGRRAGFINPAGEQQVSQFCARATQQPGWTLPRQR